MKPTKKAADKALADRLSARLGTRYAAIDHVHPAPPPPHVHRKAYYKRIIGEPEDFGGVMRRWGWTCATCGEGYDTGSWQSNFPDSLR